MTSTYVIDQDVRSALEKCRHACKENMSALLASSTETTIEAPSDPSGSPLAFATLRTDFISLLALIYAHTTRVSLAMKPPLTAPAAIKCLSDLSSEITRMASCASAVSYDDGVTLRKEFVTATQEILENILNLTEGFLQQTDSEDKSYLRRTGMLHDTVEVWKASLSSNNMQAVTKCWNANSEALEDALTEIKEMSEDGGKIKSAGENEGGEDGWDELLGEDASKSATAEETARMEKAYPLLRLTTLLHRRLLTHHIVSIKPDEHNQYLDVLVAHSSTLVSATDDLVASMYVPQDWDDIKTQIEFISDVVHTIKKDMDASEIARTISESLNLNEEPTQDKVGKKNKQWFEVCFLQIEKAIDSFMV